MLYSHDQLYKHVCICMHACRIITTTQSRRATQFFRKIYLSLYLKGSERFYCERELETEQNCNILTPTLMAITVFLSRFPGLLNWGPGGPASLGHVPHSSIFSPTRLISNWLNFLCTELYNSSTPTFFLWASQIALIQPVHGQGYILIFLDQSHLLFTRVHFLFWQPGRITHL